MGRKLFPSWREIGAAIQAMDGVAEAMAEQTRLFAESSDLMLSFGWPPILEASIRQINALLKVRDEGGEEMARTYLEKLAFHSYDDATVTRSLTAWGRKPLLARRMHLLRAGVEAHLRGDYACSVPTLLPQAEGIVLDCYRGVKELELAKCDVLVRRLLSSGDDEDALARVDRLVREFYLGQVLESIGRRDEVPDGLNRHVILHGRDVAYDTKANSLKALILVDYLSQSLVIVSSEGSAVYHRAGCPVVFRPKATFQVVSDSRVASALGKRPCRVCKPPRW